MLRLSLFFLFIFSSFSANAETSSWIHHDGAKLRLLAILEGDIVKAGLEIEMQEGWKTYWHSPGFSGIPPQVRFSGSMNLSSPQLRLPPPQSFPADESIGYKGNVVFIISSRLKKRYSPSTLSIDGQLGLCSEICVPVPIQFSVPLSYIPDPTASSILTSAISRLPDKANDTQKILKTDISSSSSDSFFVDVRVPKDSDRLSLFAYGPPEWVLGTGRLTHRDGTKARFTFESIESDSDLLGTNLHYVLSADKQSIEQSVKLGH